MYQKYLLKEPAKPIYIKSLPWAVLCDIDGTLARKGDRDIYDDSKLHLDTVVDEVRHLVSEVQKSNKIIIMSGRQDSCKETTINWLHDNEIYFDDILMRKSGDKRSDDIVKKSFMSKTLKVDIMLGLLWMIGKK